jgi:hypothetical protein
MPSAKVPEIAKILILFPRYLIYKDEVRDQVIFVIEIEKYSYLHILPVYAIDLNLKQWTKTDQG